MEVAPLDERSVSGQTDGLHVFIAGRLAAMFSIIGRRDPNPRHSCSEKLIEANTLTARVVDPRLGQVVPGA